MFMFRKSRRNTVVKRLWKARVTNHESLGSTEEEFEFKSAGNSFLKKLTESQLELLVAAVESRGADMGECVLVPKSGSTGVWTTRRGILLPHVLCATLWRWPDLQPSDELKRLSCCSSAKDPVYTCSNPYHWSRVYRIPELPPTPRAWETEKLRPEDGSNCDVWCRLAYWEGCTRVGRQFPVGRPYVQVFGDVLDGGDGLCLGTLTAQRQATDRSTASTREKIGLGLMLSLEFDGVWLYNRSNGPLFVHSPTLDGAEGFLVHKLLPGHSVLMFQYERVAVKRSSSVVQGPVDLYSVRISFLKGWGPRYSRREITQCPCWVEVILTPPR